MLFIKHLFQYDYALPISVPKKEKKQSYHAKGIRITEQAGGKKLLDIRRKQEGSKDALLNESE